MVIVDFILNFACLLLWLNWRSASMPDPTGLPGKSLTATLKRASTNRSGGITSFLMMIAILIIRSFFYRQIGLALNWTAVFDVQILAVQFSSQFLGRMMLFSFLSFGKMLLAAHTWLLLLSALHHGEPTGLSQRMVAWQLGPVHRWPRIAKLVLPWIICTLAWAAFSGRYGGTLYLPAAPTPSQFWLLASAVGVCAYLWWIPLLTGLFALHILESYVYLGKSSFWEFIAATGRKLTWPFHKLPLRIGPVDLTPALMLVLLVLVGIYGTPWLSAWLRKALF